MSPSWMWRWQAAIFRRTAFGVPSGPGIRLVVQVLVAADAPQSRHGRHPEVIGIPADDPEGLLEGHFDLESQAIDSDDVQGGQGQVRAHQQDGAAAGMVYHGEADEDADGAPQQAGGPEAEPHPLLAIDGAGRLLEPAGGGGVAGKKAALLLLTRVTRWFPWASSPRTMLPVA